MKNHFKTFVVSLIFIQIIGVFYIIFLLWGKQSDIVVKQNANVAISKKTTVNETVSEIKQKSTEIKNGITALDAEKNVKNLPEVKQFFLKNSSAKIELIDVRNILEIDSPFMKADDYLFHVYEDSKNSIKSLDWYRVDHRNGEVLSVTTEHSCPTDPDWMCPENIFFSGNYKLPADWNALLKLTSYVPEDDYVSYSEKLFLQKGDYKIIIYSPFSSGRASCIDNKDDLDKYVILNNKNLSKSFLLREKVGPNNENYTTYGFLELGFCSQINGAMRDMSNLSLDDIAIAGDVQNQQIFLDLDLTLWGKITYVVPSSPNPQIVKEMDSIVESFE